MGRGDRHDGSLVAARRRPLAGALLVLATAASIATVWLILRHGLVADDAYVLRLVRVTDLSSYYAFAVVGALLASRLPSNPVGWLLLVFGAASTTHELATQYAGHAYGAGVSVGELAVVADWSSHWLWLLGFAALPLLLLLFPDGRPPGPSWRWVGRVALGSSAGLLLVLMVGLWPRRSAVAQLRDQPDEGVFLVLLIVFMVTFAASLIACVSSLLVRFQRARGMERQQLRWLAAAAVAIVAMLTLGVVTEFTDAVWLQVVLEVGGGLALASMPVAVGLAVLRHRLYDLDRLISRTVGYGLVSLVVVAIYVTAVVGLGALVRDTAGGPRSDLVVAASTLLAATAFGPVRRRIQSVVDHRFNRARYDAQRTVERFAARLRDEVDLQALEHDLRVLVGTTVRPAWVSVWLRDQQPARRSTSAPEDVRNGAGTARPAA